MSEITSPIMLDDTGQDLVAEAQNIVTKLQSLINAVKPTAADIPLAAISGMTADDVQEGVAELKSNLTNNTYSTTGLTTHTDATLQYGGYVTVGKMVIVNMRIDITNSIGAYNEIVKGLPYPVSYASNYIAITDSKGLGMYLSTGGSIQNSVSVPTGAMQISGVYLSI